MIENQYGWQPNKRKERAREAFRDQQSQDTEGGVPCSISFIAGYLNGERYQQARIDELERVNKYILNIQYDKLIPVSCTILDGDKEIKFFTNEGVEGMFQEVLRLQKQLSKKDSEIERLIKLLITCHGIMFKSFCMAPEFRDLLEDYLKVKENSDE